MLYQFHEHVLICVYYYDNIFELLLEGKEEMSGERCIEIEGIENFIDKIFLHMYSDVLKLKSFDGCSSVLRYNHNTFGQMSYILVEDVILAQYLTCLNLLIMSDF